MFSWQEICFWLGIFYSWRTQDVAPEMEGTKPGLALLGCWLVSLCDIKRMPRVLLFGFSFPIYHLAAGILLAYSLSSTCNQCRMKYLCGVSALHEVPLTSGVAWHGRLATRAGTWQLWLDRWLTSQFAQLTGWLVNLPVKYFLPRDTVIRYPWRICKSFCNTKYPMGTLILRFEQALWQTCQKFRFWKQFQVGKWAKFHTFWLNLEQIHWLVKDVLNGQSVNKFDWSMTGKPFTKSPPYWQPLSPSAEAAGAGGGWGGGMELAAQENPFSPLGYADIFSDSE